MDSVRWIRPGCFVLGCYKLTPGGMDEYFVEVIRSKHGKISHVSFFFQLSLIISCDLVTCLLSKIRSAVSVPPLVR